jgi:hypothetical protein
VTCVHDSPLLPEVLPFWTSRLLVSLCTTMITSNYIPSLSFSESSSGSTSITSSFPTLTSSKFFFLFLSFNNPCFTSSFGTSYLASQLCFSLNIFFHLQGTMISFINSEEILCAHFILNQMLQPIYIPCNSLEFWFFEVCSE